MSRYTISMIAHLCKLDLFLSENLLSTRFSEVTSDNPSWYVVFIKNLFRPPWVRPSMDTSTYLHRDVGYGQPSQQHRAQDVQKLFITPKHHPHVNVIPSSTLNPYQ